MTTKKRAVISVIAVAAAAAVGITGFMIWKKKDSGSSSGEVFVTQVSEVNTASGISLSGSKFSGVIEEQKTEDYKYDSSKTVKSVEVQEGDEVKSGDVLFTYDVESMQLELDQGKIEVERMENEIETMNSQIEELEKEKKTTSQDGQTSLNTQILSLKSDISKNEYDIKAKKAENKKIKKSIKNASVTSKTDGTVKSVADIDNLENLESNVIVSISKGGDYLVKGTVNEQMIGNIYEGMAVIIRSRVDDSLTWSGTVSSIETTPQTSDSDYYDEGDSSNSSSKYSFYIEPETLDGLMLGQHIIIEPDLGGDSSIDRSGIWLYSDYVFEEDGKTYVWAQNDKDKIEKREVEIGQTDEEAGDCEILSGLTNDDYIAYPSDDISEGMSVTTDKDDLDIADEDYTDMDTADEDGDMGYFETEDGTYTIDEDGNFIDEDGNIVDFGDTEDGLDGLDGLDEDYEDTEDYDGEEFTDGDAAFAEE
jgi:HlyD family secretion protein